jgi:hypothetical protein
MGMKTGFWILLTAVIGIIGATAGYALSSKSGVQVGYFESAEAGGYGSAGDSVEGIDTKTLDYYKGLYQEEN